MVGGTGTVRQASEDMHREFMEAVKQGDAAAIAALFTEDGTLLPPNIEPIRGRQAIEAFFKTAFNTVGLREATVQAESVEEDGDLAYEIGDLTAKMQQRGGQARTDQGKYVLLWKRQAGGTWKCQAEMWTTLPATSTVGATFRSPSGSGYWSTDEGTD